MVYDMSHEHSKDQMIGLAVGFMGLSIVFFGLRIWARMIVKRVTLDDYLAGAALIFSIACCSLQLLAVFLGHLGQHQPQYPDGTAIMDDPGLAFFEKSKFAMKLLSVLGLGLVKSSLLVLYLTLFPNRRFQVIVYVVLGYVIIWTVSFFFAHLFTCYPITAFVDFAQDKHCMNHVAMFLAFLHTNVLADFVILILPIPMVMSVQLKLRTKMAVIGMLSLGAAVCAVSVTRVFATYAMGEGYASHPNDVTYYAAPIFVWTNIELSTAIVCSCLPTLRPIWLHFFPQQVVTGNNSYELGYSSGMRATRRTISTPGMEVDEVNLHDGGKTMYTPPFRRDSVMDTLDPMTVEALDSSSTTNLLRPSRTWSRQ